MKTQKKARVPQKIKKASYGWKSLIPFGIIAAVMIAVPLYLSQNLLNTDSEAAAKKGIAYQSCEIAFDAKIKAVGLSSTVTMVDGFKRSFVTQDSKNTQLCKPDYVMNYATLGGYKDFNPTCKLSVPACVANLPIVCCLKGKSGAQTAEQGLAALGVKWEGGFKKINNVGGSVKSQPTKVPTQKVTSGCVVASDRCATSAPKLGTGERFFSQKNPSANLRSDLLSGVWGNNADTDKINNILKPYFSVVKVGPGYYYAITTTKSTKAPYQVATTYYVAVTSNGTAFDHCSKPTIRTQLCVK
jgi:hypothetical protein